MAGDDALLVIVESEELACAARHVAVACAVEAVAAYAVFLIVLVGKGIHVGFRGHGLMEGCVEDSHLGYLGKKVEYGLDSCDVGGIVQRSHGIAFLHAGDHFGSDEHRLVEVFHAVHHTVAYGIDFVKVADHSLFRIREHLEHLADRLLVVGH